MTPSVPSVLFVLSTMTAGQSEHLRLNPFRVVRVVRACRAVAWRRRVFRVVRGLVFAAFAIDNPLQRAGNVSPVRARISRMKAVAINGSPRQGGNMEILLKKVLEPLVTAGWQTEFLQVGGKPIRGCQACYVCF